MRLDRRDAAALAREHRLAAGRVHEPAAGDRRGRAVALLDGERVRGGAGRLGERPAGDPGRAPELGALFARGLQQVLVELGAVELERRRACELRGPGLRGLAQARDVVVEEPVAEGLFRELVAHEVRPLLQHARQEVRRDLDRRLADLPVEALGLFDHEDAQLRVAALQDDRGRGAGDGAAHDDDVVLAGSVVPHGFHRARVYCGRAPNTWTPRSSSTTIVRSTASTGPRSWTFPDGQRDREAFQARRLAEAEVDDGAAGREVPAGVARSRSRSCGRPRASP